jgi:hypothetical protein
MYQPPTEKKDFHAHRGPGGTCLRGEKNPALTEKTKLAIHKLNEAIEDERLAEQMYMVLKNLLHELRVPEEAGIILIAEDEREHLQTLMNIRSSILQRAE